MALILYDRFSGSRNGPAAITVGESEAGDMNVSIQALGTVTPLDTVTVYSQITGRVMAVHYTEGQMVQQGDIASLRVFSQQIRKQQDAVKAAQSYLDLALSRYQTGLDPYLNVITAQTTLLADQQAEVTLRVVEMTAAVQLIQALGGGWDASQLPTAQDVRAQAAGR